MRSMGKKQISSLLLALFLTLVLAACSTDSKDPSPDVPPDQTPSEEEARVPAREQKLDPNKETLVYANLSPQYSGGYQVDWDAVEEFNASHDDIQIEVRDYGALEYSEIPQCRSRLLTELASGQVPDIIEVGYLPYRQMAQRGYLEDLWPYIESDPDLGRENVMEAPLKAAEVDGGLYMAFGRVTINTLIGAESAVGSRYSWTLEDIQEALASMPDDSTIMEYYMDRNQLAQVLLSMLLDSHVDWETGTCNFDTPDFRSSLEFLSSFPSFEEMESYIANTPTAVLTAEAEDRMMNGRQLLERGLGVTSIGDIITLDLRHGGRCAFVGYPTADGSAGSSFRPQGRQLAMSSACKNKEAAWEFIRTVLMPSYNYTDAIPVNRADYDMGKGYFMRTEQLLRPFFSTEERITAPPMSEEQAQRFDDFFNSIEKISLSDETLYDIVMDAAAPYFAGDKTLDETVGIVQNRVSLYVNEQR